MLGLCQFFLKSIFLNNKKKEKKEKEKGHTIKNKIKKKKEKKSDFISAKQQNIKGGERDKDHHQT